MTSIGYHGTIAPTREGLAAASAELADYLAIMGVPPAAIGRVELVLEEVVMNTITHGAPPSGPIRIRLEAHVDPGFCHLTILDNGLAFDPTTAPLRQDGASLDQATPGGLGLVLLRTFAQRLEYLRVPFGNRLDLTIVTTSPLPSSGTLR